MNPKVTSAGGLIVRPCVSGWETLLVGNSNPTVWRIPKGMAEAGETLEQTAVREVLEETGVRGIIFGFIGTAGWTYAYGGRDWDETVFFFLMNLAEGNTKNHDTEFERVEWLKLEDATKALYYKNEAEIAEKAGALLQSLPSQNTESGREDTFDLLIDKNAREIVNIGDLKLLGSGLSLGGNVATGRVATDAASLNEFIKQEQPVIFVSNELAPRDAALFTRCQGLLAAKGGITSHMAVVMRGLSKACISGIQEMSLTSGSKGFNLRDQLIKEGDWLTLDEKSGGIYFGKGDLQDRHVSQEMREIIRWADSTRRARIFVNADDTAQVKTGLIEGADGVGLVRSEHQIFAEEVLQAFRCVLLLQDGAQKSGYIEIVARVLEGQLVEMLRVLNGRPLHYRLLDAPINEFIPAEGEALASLAELVGITEDQIRNQILHLREANSLFGCRGSRWGIVHPKFYKRQIELALSAGMQVASEGIPVALTVVVPMVSTEEELKYWSTIFQQQLAGNSLPSSYPLKVRLGAMVETPRAALSSAGLATHVDMLCIGTNDLTQAVWAMSRDDVSRFYPQLVTSGIADFDPFRTLDRIGVGALIERSITEARRVRPDTEFYVCGEHASDPESVKYFIGLGVNGVSCAADRVSGIKVVVAQAELTGVEGHTTIRHLPRGSGPGQNSSDVLKRIVTEVHQSNHAVAQKIALQWAHEIAQRHGLESPAVWKYFKRNLVEKWFGAGERIRFGPGWDTEEAIAYATSHTGRKVRYSLFPLDIACHAISKALPDNATAEAWRAEFEPLDHSIAVEIFPQQPEDYLCFRAVLQGDEFRFEAGIGQAMYVFEQERGDHPFVQGFFDISSRAPRVTGRHKDQQQTTSIEDGLIRLLNLHGDDLLLKCRDICETLGVKWLAIEGYYDLHNQTPPFICDLDLPQDLAFHGS
jgi:phosphoenolpyruvate-protein kinase (PTS system EI component)/8-oxo-dGTP pyrophosphatase MutT (NUDIX family)